MPDLNPRGVARYKHGIYLFGSGALFGKILLVRIVGNNKIDAYFRAGRLG